MKYIFRYDKLKADSDKSGNGWGYGASGMRAYDGKRVFFKGNEPKGYGRIPCKDAAHSAWEQLDEVDVVSAHIDWCEVVK